ncbi:MAG: hypothetical protein ABIP53_03100 [Candidatus Limnocylindrales bacterium]
MTVLQGVRPMAIGGAGLLPRIETSPRIGARPIAGRRKLTSRAATGRRAQPFGGLLAIVLVGLMIGLLYVGQTINLAATNIEIENLAAERDDLARQVQTIETSVLRWGTESTVFERAQLIGLDQLETRVRLPAR